MIAQSLLRLLMASTDAASPTDEALDLLATATWWIDADEHDGNTSVENLGTGGALTGTESGVSFRAYDTAPGFDFFGTASYISTADKAALDLDSFDIRVRIRMDDWTPAAITPLVSKFAEAAGSDSNRAYYFRVLTDGTIGVILRTTGANNIYTSTAATGFTNGTINWIRVTRDRTSGDVKFYTAADSNTDPGSWTQLGTTVSGTTNALRSVANDVFIGSIDGTTSNATGCRIYHVVIRDAASSGTVVANMSAAEAHEMTGWGDAYENTWSVTKIAGQRVVLVDRNLWMFDGVNDYIEWADNAAFDLGAGEDCTWIVVCRINPGAADRVILSKHNGTTGFNLFTNNAATPRFNFSPGAADTGSGPVIAAAGTRTAVLAATVDLASADETITWWEAVPGTANPVSDGSITNASVMRIGCTSAGASFAVIELIAAARFNRVLTSVEINLLNVYYKERDGWYVANAVDPLTTPTYDASGEAAHPGVVDMGTAWNGYRYWMAFTPYPGGDDDFENPSILVSNDRETWSEPPVITNPIDAKPSPAAAANADTDLVYDSANDRLICYYNEYDGTTTKYARARYSSDGVTWSAEQALFSVTAASNNPLSPAVTKEGSTWVMRYIDNVDSPNSFNKRTESDPIGGSWTAESALTLTGLPAGRDLWHIDVFVDSGSVWRAIVNVCDRGVDADAANTIHLASSSDGTTWVMNVRPLMYPRPGAWDSSKLYRGSAVEIGSTCHLWYSALSGVDSEWHIGYVTFPMAKFPTP
jgi:hypothetical protein